MEITNEERPNNPESNGRRGCSTGRLNVRRPKIPERTKIVNEMKKLSSLKIMYIDRKINRNGINSFIDE